MQQVLITGAAGFCGTHLAARLRREQDVAITGLDRVAPREPAAWAGFVTVDMGDAAAVSGVLQRVRPDVIYHLAGVSAGTPEELESSIVHGTRTLLEAVRRHAPAARVLTVGSAAEYGPVQAAQLPVDEETPCRPADAYGRAKHAATLAALEYAAGGLQVVVARPFNIVGAGVPGGLVVGALIRRLLELRRHGGALRVGNLETQRDFVAVEDVVDAYVALAAGNFAGEVVNICSGEPRTIRSIAERLVALAGGGIALEVDPALVRPADVPVSYGSRAKAARLIDYAPRIPLERALDSAWQAALETE